MLPRSWVYVILLVHSCTIIHSRCKQRPLEGTGPSQMPTAHLARLNKSVASAYPLSNVQLRPGAICTWNGPVTFIGAACSARRTSSASSHNVNSLHLNKHVGPCRHVLVSFQPYFGPAVLNAVSLLCLLTSASRRRPHFAQ